MKLMPRCSYGWVNAYSPEALAKAVAAMDDQPSAAASIFFLRACVFAEFISPW